MIFDRLKSGGSRVLSPEEMWDYLRGPESASGKRVTVATAMRHAIVFACVRVLAEAVGQLPLHLLAEKNGTRTKATDHPLFELLHISPNEEQTAQEWVEMIVVHLALRGNHYSEISWNASRTKALELLPLHPDRVAVRQLDDRRLVYDVTRKNGKRDTLPAEDVFHVPLLSDDGVKGMSPIRYGAETIGLAMAVHDHAARLFKNGARPGGIISTENQLGDDGRKNVTESWNAAHQGVENFHGVAVLEYGLKYQALGMTPEDAQMLESRKLSDRQIAAIMRVPLMLLQDLERATFTNSEQQARVFVDYSLMPYLTRIEQRIRKQLLVGKDRVTHFAKFNVGALLRGDMKTRAEFYTRQVQNGALSPNEIRGFEDMNPREGGDIYLTPANMLIDGKPPPAEEPKADPLAGK
jgi:HK97 family phage portal protein